MNYYQFVFKTTTEETRDVLIAMLCNIGFEGFEEDDNQLKAFIKTGEYSKADFDDFIGITKADYSQSTIETINWNQKWESEFQPITVLDPVSHIPFVNVRAYFHKADSNVLHDILITPKMSFGTGHHATTYLMIEQMSQVDFKNKSVIDFGTGTAVLAILAEKLGASYVIAIDNDDWSINNALENIEANHCNTITVLKAETIETAAKADIVLANINLNVILQNIDNIAVVCNPGALILFSGVLKEDEIILIGALKKKSFSIINILNKSNWLVVIASC